MPRPHCDLFGPIFTVKATVSLVSRVRCYHSWTHNSRESSFSLGTGAMTQPLLCPHTSPAKVQRVAQGESRPPERARVCVCAATNTASYRREPWHWRSSPTRSHARTDIHASAGPACTHELTPTNTRRRRELFNKPRAHALVSCH